MFKPKNNKLGTNLFNWGPTYYFWLILSYFDLKTIFDISQTLKHPTYLIGDQFIIFGLF